jgi:hypothetical protein
VLTSDVRFEGWTADDWVRFLQLWKPRASPAEEPTRPRGGVFVVHDGSRVRKLLHTGRGRMEPGGPWPVPLSALAKEHHASWVMAAHLGALDEIMERFGARAKRGDDITAQSLLLVTIVREMMAEGAVSSYPHRLRGVPQPTEAMVQRALDAVCPDGFAIALGMFKDEELWTAFVARRRGRGFDVIAGPDELRPAMGLLSGDWRRDYRHLVRAAEERYAPLAFGCFAELEAFRELQTDARPGAWTRAVAVRDVILSPIPLAVGLALGVDGARYAAGGVMALTGRMLPLTTVFDPLIRAVRDTLGTATGKDVPGALGFDPMAALRSLLRR